MPIKFNLTETFMNLARGVANNIAHTRNHLKEKWQRHKQRMKEDPQVRIASFHAAVYLTCLAAPAAIGVYLSLKHDGTWNVWRVPDNVEKVEMIAKEPD